MFPRRILRPVLIAAAVLWVPVLSGVSTALAACPAEARVRQAADAFFVPRATAAYGPALTVEEAYCAQKQYVAMLTQGLGPRAGFKVAFGGKLAQERFNVTEPARGTLLRDMMLRSGAIIDASKTVRPLVEPDLIVRVKDRGIMSAKTPLEALAHLDEIVPFIEFADLIIAEGETINGANIIAFNAAARYGITGDGIAVRPTAEWVAAFAEMEGVFTDDTGKELSRAKGASLGGNPLNLLLWLIDNLNKEGTSLVAGDEISLGAMGAIMTPEPGRTYTVRYEGLPGRTPTAMVTVR
jgi:2-keto-4-pentenoate hydratase